MPQVIQLLRADQNDDVRPESPERDPGPARTKTSDAEEWDRLCKHPRRVPWVQAREMSNALARIAGARLANEARRIW